MRPASCEIFLPRQRLPATLNRHANRVRQCVQLALHFHRQPTQAIELPARFAGKRAHNTTARTELAANGLELFIQPANRRLQQRRQIDRRPRQVIRPRRVNRIDSGARRSHTAELLIMSTHSDRRGASENTQRSHQHAPLHQQDSTPTKHRNTVQLEKLETSAPRPARRRDVETQERRAFLEQQIPRLARDLRAALRLLRMRRARLDRALRAHALEPEFVDLVGLSNWQTRQG